MGVTSIEWTEATWNPVRGCTKVSEGCRNCYAETFAERWRGIPGHPYEQGFDLRLVPEKLAEPLHWKKPRRVFVNSMSDLFHKDVPFEYIDQVFAVMALCPQHTFQVLTKRPERMAEYLDLNELPQMRVEKAVLDWHHAQGVTNYRISNRLPVHPLEVAEKLRYRQWWPLPNVWLGASVENQATADERIPHLLRCPAAVRFLSCEPLLGPIDLSTHLGIAQNHDDLAGLLGWAIVGGESGHGARPMHPDWARSLRDQCVSSGVPFFFKQWGEWMPPPFTAAQKTRGRRRHDFGDGCSVYHIGKKVADRMLDCREWNEYPQTALSQT